MAGSPRDPFKTADMKTFSLLYYERVVNVLQMQDDEVTGQNDFIKQYLAQQQRNLERQMQFKKKLHGKTPQITPLLPPPQTVIVIKLREGTV